MSSIKDLKMSTLTKELANLDLKNIRKQLLTY